MGVNRKQTRVIFVGCAQRADYLRSVCFSRQKETHRPDITASTLVMWSGLWSWTGEIAVSTLVLKDHALMYGCVFRMWGSFMSWCHILLSNLSWFHINNIQVNCYILAIFLSFLNPRWTEEHTEYLTWSNFIASWPQKLETKLQSSFLLKFASMWLRHLQCGIATECWAAASQTTTHAPSGRCRASVRPVGEALSFSTEDCCCNLYHATIRYYQQSSVCTQIYLHTRKCMHTHKHYRMHPHYRMLEWVNVFCCVPATDPNLLNCVVEISVYVVFVS